MTGSQHFPAVGRADPPVEIELERQADQGGDRVRQLLSEVVALARTADVGNLGRYRCGHQAGGRQKSRLEKTEKHILFLT